MAEYQIARGGTFILGLMRVNLPDTTKNIRLPRFEIATGILRMAQSPKLMPETLTNAKKRLHL